MSDYRSAWLSARSRANRYRLEIAALEERLANSNPASEMAKKSWANTKDRAARTEPARAARDERFLEQAGWDYAYAERLKKEHYRSMAERSHESRRRNKAAREAGDAS